MRSKDRLAELQQLAGSAGVGPAVYRDTVEVALKPSPDQADIDALFIEVERMRSWIHELNGNTQLMCRLHADPTFHTNKRRSAGSAGGGDRALERHRAAGGRRAAGAGGRGGGARGAARRAQPHRAPAVRGHAAPVRRRAGATPRRARRAARHAAAAAARTDQQISRYQMRSARACWIQETFHFSLTMWRRRRRRRGGCCATWRRATRSWRGSRARCATCATSSRSSRFSSPRSKIAWTAWSTTRCRPPSTWRTASTSSSRAPSHAPRHGRIK